MNFRFRYSQWIGEELSDYFFPLVINLFFLQYFTLMSTRFDWVNLIFTLSVILQIALVWRLKRTSTLRFVVKGKQKLFLLFWIVFGTLVFISEIVHNNFSESISLLLTLPLFCFLFLPKLSGIGPKSFFFAMHLACVPYLFLVLFLYGIGYRTSTNGIGLLLLAGQISNLLLSQLNFNKAGFAPFIFRRVVTYLYLIALFLVRSRTCMITASIIFLFHSVLIAIDSFRGRQKDKVLFYFLVEILVITAVLVICGLDTSFLFDKYGSGMTSGRAAIWKFALQNPSPLGHGYHFFEANGFRGPHNVLVALLSYYGYLPLVFFVFSMIIYLGDSIRKKEVTILVVLGFFLAGMFETFLVQPSYRGMNIMLLYVVGEHFNMEQRPHTYDKKVSWVCGLSAIGLYLVCLLVIPDQSNLLRAINQVLGYIK